MINELITPHSEECKLQQCRMFTNRGFMVTITRDDGSVLFYPYMVSNFSIDEKKVFVTIYDLIQSSNIEESLDELLKGFLWFKKKVNITLIRLDVENEEVYRIDYKKCQLKKYHGKNFTYKGSDMHQWYLEFTFAKKELVKNNDFKFTPIVVDVDSIKNIPTNNVAQVQRHKRMSKQEAAILKNSNKMLDEAIEKVKDTKRLTQDAKTKKIREINKAKSENENAINQFYGKTFSGEKLKEMEKWIEVELNEIENNTDI